MNICICIDVVLLGVRCLKNEIFGIKEQWEPTETVDCRFKNSKPNFEIFNIRISRRWMLKTSKPFRKANDDEKRLQSYDVYDIQYRPNSGYFGRWTMSKAIENI